MQIVQRDVEQITDPFGYQQDHHNGQQKLNILGGFHQDDGQRNRHARDPSDSPPL